MSDKLKLAEMLCTRFCHDIIGPVGAVNNGAEFLREEMKDSTSQAADLIESSAKETVARVQFYRQAYGQGGSGSAVNLQETRKLAVDFFAAGKIKLDWADEHTTKPDVEFAHKKIILNLLVIAAASLIRGGSIKFEITNNNAVITAKGEKAAVPANFELVLAGKLPQDEIDPRLIQCHYTAEIAAASRTIIEVNKDVDMIRFLMSLNS